MDNVKIESWFEIIDRELIKLYDAFESDVDYELFDFDQLMRFIIEEEHTQGLKERYSDKINDYIYYLKQIFVETYATTVLEDVHYNDDKQEYKMTYVTYFSDNKPNEKKSVTYPYRSSSENIPIEVQKRWNDELIKNRHDQKNQMKSSLFSVMIPNERIFYQGVHYRQSEEMWFDVSTYKKIDNLQKERLNHLYRPKQKISQFIKDLRAKGYLLNNDITDPARLETIFNNIQDKILYQLDKAKVSIYLAVAWFTNTVLRDKLLEKQQQGVRIEIVTNKDGVNTKHGVDLTPFDHKPIRGKNGGLMHNKFCVIDNQVVINGSYNWSINAEQKNYENITIDKDSKRATEFSIEFRKLKPLEL